MKDAFQGSSVSISQELNLGQQFTSLTNISTNYEAEYLKYCQGWMHGHHVSSHEGI
jgi:hypothetical protein